MPVSPQDWEKIKQAAIAGVHKSALLKTFPELTWDALKKRSQREKWPTPERVAFLMQSQSTDSSDVPASVSSPQNSTGDCPKGDNSMSQGQPEGTNSALSLTLESTKGLVNASLGRFVQRAVKRVDQWDIPAPQSMKDGLALVNSLARLHQPAPQHLSQVNMQFVSPWGTASGAKFLEVETPEEP